MMIRTAALAAIAALTACSTPAHSAPAPRPTHSAAHCDWARTPQFCDPDDNPQDRTGNPIAEDTARWIENCLTTGNHKCGPHYHMIDEFPKWQSREFYNAITAESADAHYPTDPYTCLVRIGDTTIIVCQNGWMTTS